MKMYELIRDNGTSAGLFRTKREANAAWIDNFLEGGEGLTERVVTINPNE